MISYLLDFRKIDVHQNTLTGATYLDYIFKCPFEVGRPECTVSTNTFVFVYASEINFNNLVQFKLPCCDNTVQLYMAIHKEPNAYEFALCTQRSDGDSIPSDWWHPLPV